MISIDESNGDIKVGQIRSKYPCFRDEIEPGYPRGTGVDHMSFDKIPIRKVALGTNQVPRYSWMVLRTAEESRRGQPGRGRTYMLHWSFPTTKPRHYKPTKKYFLEKQKRRTSMYWQPEMKTSSTKKLSL